MPAKVAVVIYSTWGHVAQLVQKAEKGLESAGVEYKAFKFPETLAADVLEKMHAAPPLDLPEVTPDALKEFDGFFFAFPTRYGRAPAQVSAFFDATGGIWASGAYVGKMATVMTSTAGQHGGQETTALTTIPWCAHQGVMYVPMGYGHPSMVDTDEILGSSAYGAATLAGADGSRQPTEKEYSIAEFHGSLFGKVVFQYVAGGEVLANGTTTATTTLASADNGAAKKEDPAQKKEEESAKKTTEPAKKEQKKGGLFSCCTSGAAKNVQD